ncbi:MAG: bifunctional oligoribonuclease/PAP phosphatase NrnA [bacterium]|nr:bifunctional oligoribonuclease/PAP phosphatase NrnA [bacterium]
MTTTPAVKTDWAAAAQAVQTADRILLVTHIYPDGDAIGSLLGVANALWARGKQVDTAVDGGVPDFLQFVPHANRVLPALTSGTWDVMISLDSSDEERTGECGAYGRAHSTTVINLDHHRTNTFFGHIHLVDSESVSATEVAYHWLTHMNDPITPDVAIPLLTGLVTDTNGFRVSSVKPSTLRLAQVLVEAGAPLNQIMARTLNSQKYITVEIWKRVLPTVQLADGVISAEVRQEHLRDLGLTEIPELGLVSWLVSVDEAGISVVFKEKADDTIEISLRSKLPYDVGSVALTLGGGGHKQASGATVRGSLADVRALVLPLLVNAVRNPLSG